MKKVMILAQYFPPASGVGTFRVTKFVKYLKDFNWNSVVLTLNEESYAKINCPLDHSLMNDISVATAIYRTGLHHLLFFKDAGIRWLPTLFYKMPAILFKERPHLLFVTGGPFFSLLIAPLVRFIFGIKYVVDLRDPWRIAEERTPPQGMKARLVELANRICEPLVLHSASKIVLVSEQMGREYRNAYVKRPETDFVVIPNGYDPDDFDPVTPHQFPKFTIVYTGKFQTGEAFRNPTSFFESLKLIKGKKIDIQFIHVGNREEKVIDIAKQIGVLDVCEFMGRKSYHDAISFAKGADMLLLIGGGQKTEQTGKIFDYMGCNRKILALANKSSGIGDVIGNIDASATVLIEEKDPKRIANAIEDHYKATNATKITTESYKQYHRKSITARLSDIFCEVMNT